MRVHEYSDTSGPPLDFHEPYGGYHRRDIPPEDAELTHVGPGTPCGEYMRKFWQPICLSQQLTDVPLAIRILGEDLVAFRDRSDRLGVLHRHCSHRGTSLEYGIVSERGIRCCYHGWLFDIDGTILETPGETPGSRLKDSLCHGAYAAFEHNGLVFAYMGTPEEKPDFPMFEEYDPPNTKVLAFSNYLPCNWLQAYENGIDILHNAIFHNGVGNAAPQRGEGKSAFSFNGAFEEIPVTEWRLADDGSGTGNGSGMISISTRRLGDKVWVRMNHCTEPNYIHSGTFWENAKEVSYHKRLALTRWMVPIDDTHTWALGWRYFNDRVDPEHLGNEDEVGVDKVDHLAGQTWRPYEEGQRDPGDYEVMVNQRPIAVHALEHLGWTDTGVAMLRQIIRRGVRGETPRGLPTPAGSRTDICFRSYTSDTVLLVPKQEDHDDRELLRGIGDRVAAVVFAGHAYTGVERDEFVKRRLAEIG